MQSINGRETFAAMPYAAIFFKQCVLEASSLNMAANMTLIEHDGHQT